MKIIALPLETTAITGYTHKINVTHVDVAALGAAATGTLQIFPYGTDTASAGTVVRAMAYKLVTAFDFSDAGITSLTLELGGPGADHTFLAATQIAVDGTEILYAHAISNGTQTIPYVLVTADGIDAFFTAANGGSPLLSECNAGEIDIFIGIFDMDAVSGIKQP
jgi:hypothetical protein